MSLGDIFHDWQHCSVQIRVRVGLSLRVRFAVRSQNRLTNNDAIWDTVTVTLSATLEPRLALGHGEPLHHQVTYTLQITDGLHFQNGNGHDFALHDWLCVTERDRDCLALQKCVQHWLLARLRLRVRVANGNSVAHRDQVRVELAIRLGCAELLACLVGDAVAINVRISDSKRELEPVALRHDGRLNRRAPSR